MLTNRCCRPPNVGQCNACAWQGMAIWLMLLLLPAGVFSLSGDTPGPLELMEEPSDLVVSEGESASLQCRGPPASSVRWRHGGLALTPSTDRSVLQNGTLVFSAVRSVDGGEYQCQVELPEGGVLLSRSATLQLADLARTGPATGTLTVFLGQTARFPCGVEGRPTPSVRWLKDDQPFSSADPGRQRVLPSGSLELDHVLTSDSGVYFCRAQNEHGFELGTHTRLIINTNYEEANSLSAPRFVARPANTVARRGRTVTLDCAANGNPRPRVTWLKDGTTIDMSYLGRRFFLVGVSSLEIADVREVDSGTYQCRVYNSVDSADASAQLRVTVPPEFDREPEDTVASQKEDVALRCAASGAPPPRISWTKNGEQLESSDYFKLEDEGRTLRILGLVQSDAGVYQCFAANSADNVQSAARLQVLPIAARRSDGGNSLQAPSMGVVGQPAAAAAATAPRNVTARIVGTRFVTLTWRGPLSSTAQITNYSVVYRRADSDRERVFVTAADSDWPSQQIQGLQPDAEYEFRVQANVGAVAGRSSAPLRLRTHREQTVPAAPRHLLLVPAAATRLRASWEPVSPAPDTYRIYVAQSLGGEAERAIDTADTSHMLEQLHKYTSYTVRVAAVNANGPGPSTPEVTAVTWSDVPSETPQNISVETATDTSVIVHWEPPPMEHRNGLLTGYKIRYKRQGASLGGRRGAQTEVTDAGQRSFTLRGLQKDAEYLLKMAALTVNGTGPYTRWHPVKTLHRLLVETTVPDQPGSLRARPTETTITVLWSPPKNKSIRVRGYTLGWGRGVPDTYTEIIDENQHHYVIHGLEPNAEYVVSLRALNAAGNGTPVYEKLWTRLPADQLDRRPLVIPTGLKAIVVSATAAVVHWTDRSLPNQVVTDGRQYRVRFSRQAAPDKYRYYNASQLNCMLDNLRPATAYEFSVQAVKGTRQSDWSLIVVNQTLESAPSSPPRDLTIVQSEENPAIINLSWQPPKAPNGRIDGYVIQYTTDRSLPDRDWLVHPVVGDTMTTRLSGLTPSTVYWFRIQARNSAGNSPISRPAKLKTSSEPGYSLSGNRRTGGGGLGDHLLYVVVACSATLLLVICIIAAVCLCKRKPARHSPRRLGHKRWAPGAELMQSNSYVKGHTEIGTPDLKPPDLWIHHDQMELRPLGGKQRADSCGSLRRSSPDYSAEQRAYSSTLDRRERAGRSHSPGGGKGDSGWRSEDRLDGRHLHRRSAVKPNPIVVPIDSRRPQSGTSATALANGTVETRPVYPRTQFSISRTLGSEPPPPPAPTAPESHYGAGLGLASASSSEVGGPTCLPGGYPASTASSCDSGSLGKRSAPPPLHPLKSFGCPAPPPPLSAGGRPLGSPLKKPSFACSPRAGDMGSNREELAPLRPSHSTEELTQEMANLEGLMKDLNAITASEFQC